MTTFAGNRIESADNGAAMSASFKIPNAVAMDFAGNLTIGEYGNNIIRKVTLGSLSILPALPAGLIFNANIGGILP